MPAKGVEVIFSAPFLYSLIIHPNPTTASKPQSMISESLSASLSVFGFYCPMLSRKADLDCDSDTDSDSDPDSISRDSSSINKKSLLFQLTGF